MAEQPTLSAELLALLEHAKARIGAVLATIHGLKQGEFPTDDAREALVAIERLFAEDRDYLDQITPQYIPRVVREACSESLKHVFSFMPFLGFLLRCTNIRNSFELYRPLLQLAKALLDPIDESVATRLLLSSEWDYSPYTYTEMDDDTGKDYLREFVLIGTRPGS